MVLQKRLDYGFHGYQFPPTPRAARSARRRGSFKKRHEDNKVCAFDLLAIVAGKLLLEKEPAPSWDNLSANKDQSEVVNNSVKEERRDEEKPLKVEAQDHEGPCRSFFVSDLGLQVHEQNLRPKESVYSQDDINLSLASTITSDLLEKSNSAKSVNGAGKNETEIFACKVEAGPSGHGESIELGVERNKPMKDEYQKSRMVLNGSIASMYRLEDPVVWNGKPHQQHIPAPVGSDDSLKVPLCGKPLPHSSYPTNWDDVDVVSRDDDENSSGCTYPRTTKKYSRPAPRIGDRRIRKILASRYWKVAPRLKDMTLSNGDGMKPTSHKRKSYCKHQRSEKMYPLKKRKYFQYSSPSPSSSDGAISREFFSDCPHNCADGDISGCCSKIHEGTGASSSITAENTSFQPRDSHVKLRIKSFRVPELFIEIPETATIGLLKRSVMEAVTAILGGGLHVGVLLQGKKVKDDSKTLLQTGISHNDQLDAVGFSLEPNPSQTTPSICTRGSPFLLSCDAPQPLCRYPASPSVLHQGTCAASLEPHVTNLGSVIESDHDSAPSPVDMSIDKNTTTSKALVAVPSISVEALAVVPAHRKSKRSEIVQRRIRRPFSVAEVEALVQAVEKLGTGRWRDVKLQAFDNAKHRTYVDLKDKWKTLVHTARISPQQRRGEPVPQELLDRVLTAHAYWSQHQAKQQQVKHQHHQQPDTCLLL